MLVATLLVVALCGDTVAGHARETEFVVFVQLGALAAMLLGGAADLVAGRRRGSRRRPYRRDCPDPAEDAAGCDVAEHL